MLPPAPICYSCDHFVTPEHRIGDLGNGHLATMIDGDSQGLCGRDKHDTLLP